MTAWQARAACRDADPELFFPASDDFTAIETAAQLVAAAKVCHHCPVRRECLTYAVDSGQRHGIWAGHTPGQLRSIRRHRRAGVPHPDIDVAPMCPGCSLLFPMPAVDGQLCAGCLERLHGKGA
ncbi:WhiB family transcriptional regulator [Actinomycetospora soli]|uniref:WhiB family transcriptional regulator n=1 Tax=Actinomycetospora soli TaxID=2893887 RepID=UPI001E62060F|nr:WhiB family transcriptional regulator [Actinomycetospora soli]MCD2186192.1 WhiB family transcriptional regulator [Actinomycetospora soli]